MKQGQPFERNKKGPADKSFSLLCFYYNGFCILNFICCMRIRMKCCKRLFFTYSSLCVVFFIQFLELWQLFAIKNMDNTLFVYLTQCHRQHEPGLLWHRRILILIGPHSFSYLMRVLLFGIPPDPSDPEIRKQLT